MPRSSPYQGSFEGGEISPLWYGRKDEDDYKKSLARSYNGFPTLQGGWTRRGGTKYVSTAGNSGQYVRLIPFKISQNSAFMLEFGANYFRVYSNRGPVYTSGTTPYQLSTQFAAADLPGLKFSQYKNTLYIANANGRPYQLVYTSQTSWAMTPITFSDGPYVKSYIPGITGPILSGEDVASAAAGGATGTGPFSGLLVQPAGIQILQVNVDPSGLYAQITVAPMQFEYLQQYDQIYIQGLTGALATFNNISWSIVPNSPTQITLLGAGYSGGVVTGITGAYAYDMTFIPKHFPASPVSQFRFLIPSVNPTIYFSGPISHEGIIDGFLPAFSVTTNRGGLSSATTLGTYYGPAWGPFPSGSIYPSCVVFHENRLFWGSINDPQIYGSFVGNFTKYSPTDFAANSTTDNTVITDACAVSFAFLANESYYVNWLSSDEKGLITGTSGGPWIVRPSTLSEAITPTNITAKRVTTYPTSQLTQATVGKSAIYVETSGRRIREVAYRYDVDGFIADNLSEEAEHLPAVGMVSELVYQNTPNPIVWGARADGTLIGITYDRTIDKVRKGFSQHVLGGVSDTSGNIPIIESLAVIPSPDGTYDDLWMSVKRYINGTTIRTIEYMTKVFESFDILQNAFFLDCGYTYDNPQVLNPSTTALSSSGGLTVVNVTAHGLATGDNVRFYNISGLAPAAGQPSSINGLLFTVTVIDANNFYVIFDSSHLTPFVLTDATVLGLPGFSCFRKMVSSISGLAWLKGATLDILGDGSYSGSATVDSSGNLALPIAAGTVNVGFPMSSEFQMLRLEAGSADGTSFGKLRRISELGIMVYNSGSFEYGANFSTMYETIDRQVSDNVNQSIALYSGIESDLTVDFNYDTENQICIRQKRPLPLTVTAVMPQQVTYDKS